MGCYVMHVLVDTVQGSSAVQDVQHVRTWMGSVDKDEDKQKKEVP